jgi:hypothetical protein
MQGTGFDGGWNDFTLLRLREAPPENITRLGWETGVQALDSQVVSIHHPRGEYKRISFGTLIDIDNVYSNNYHQVLWQNGTTESGSSGSCLMRADTQRVIGQLWGGLASCTQSTEPDFYGRFDVTYAIIANYLNPTPGSIGFTGTQFDFEESDGVVQVGVTLSSAVASGESVTASYTVLAGTAGEDTDYTVALGTLLFEPGDIIKTFDLSILEDIAHEESESIILSITSVTGDCILVDDSTGDATLMIHDNDPDMDGDGLSDEEESTGFFGYISDPTRYDTDGDSLSDYDEVTGEYDYVTNPALADTDLDGVSDGDEITFGWNPLDPDEWGQLPSMHIPFFTTQN